MTELRYNNADLIKEEKTEKKKGKDELSRFEKFMEKGKELMRKPVTWALVGATAVFLSCGSSGKTEDDVDTDTIEEVEVQEDTDVLEDVRDMIEDGTDIEEDVVEIIDDEMDAVEDVEEEELPPPECPAPVEHTPPTLNSDFELNVTDPITTAGEEISANYDLHISMNPDISSSECPVPSEGRYEFVCVDEDTVNIEGQYYLTADNVVATLPPASDETNICSTIPTENQHPVLVYEGNTPETLRNVHYSGIEIDSIAGFEMGEPSGFYFDVDGVKNEIMDLTLTPLSSGTSVISFKRDATSITFNTRSFDGRGNEAENSHDANISDVSSGVLNIVAFNSSNRVSQTLSVDGSYELGNLCIRCDGGPHYIVREIPLSVICAQENDCGCLGEPSNISFETTNVHVTPGWIAHTLSATVSMSTPTITGAGDNPKIIVEFTYTPPSDIDAMGITITGNVVVQGGEHVCSTGTSFSASYSTIISASDVGEISYSPSAPVDPRTCRCTFGG